MVNFSSYSKKYFNIDHDKGLMSDLFFAVSIAVIIFLIVFMIPQFFYEVVKIDGDSMLPTLHNEDRIGIIKTKKINYGDIVVINAKGLDVRENVEFIVKRVIGLEGDTVWIDYYKDDDVSEYRIYRSRDVNGETKFDILDEPWIYQKMNSDALNTKYKVGPGKIFVIGDNRNISFKDVVSVNKILGKCVTILTKTKTFNFIIEINWYKTKFIKNPYERY